LVRSGEGTNTIAGKRRRYGAEFKAKVTLEALKGELTIAQLVAKHGVHQTLINSWKRQAIDGMAGVFSGKAEVEVTDREAQVDRLHAKIGELVVERDFLRKASGR
jgi:transposase